MEIFVKPKYAREKYLGFFVAGSVSFLVILYTIAGMGLAVSIGIHAILFFLAVMWYRYVKKFGLIISEDTICYKGWRKKEISPQNIKAIRISKAVIQIGHHYSKYIDMKDSDGNQLYTMFLLHTYYPWDMHQPDAPTAGDLSFDACHRQCIFCYAIYDQNAVDYLKTLNPDIVVIPPEGSEPERVTGPVRGWIKWVTRKDWTPYRPYNEKKEEDIDEDLTDEEITM